CGIDGICRSTCTSDANCQTGQVCRDTFCFTTCTESKECLSEGRLNCWNGVCRQKCVQATDCPDGLMCSLKGECEKICHFNADCDVINGETCINGHCKSGCQSDGDCSTSQICSVSKLSNNGLCTWKCATTCDAGKICGADGVCRNSCTSCQSDEECLYGSCFKTCKSDADCTEASNLTCMGLHCMAVCVSDVDCTDGRLCSVNGTCNYQCKSVACPHPSLCALDGVCRFNTATCQDGYAKNSDDGFCYLTCDSENSDTPCNPTRIGKDNKPLDPSIFESNQGYTAQQLAAQATSPLTSVSMTCIGGNLCKAGCILDTDCSKSDACDQETHKCVRRADAPVLTSITGCWYGNISLRGSYGNLSFTLDVTPKNTAECREAFSTTAIVRLNLSSYQDTIVKTLSDFSLPDTRTVQLVCNPSTIQNCRYAMLVSMSASVSIESATHIMSATISDFSLEKYDYNTCFMDTQSSIHFIKLLDDTPTKLCALIVWNQSCPYLYTNKVVSSTLIVHSDDGSGSHDDQYSLPTEVMSPSKETYCTVIDDGNQDVATKIADYFNDIWLTGELLLNLSINEVQTEVTVELSGLSTAFMKGCIQDNRVIISPTSISAVVKEYESANDESCAIPTAIKQIVLTAVVKDYTTDAFIILERALPSFSYASTTSLMFLCGTGYRRTTASDDCSSFFTSISNKSLSSLDGDIRIALYDTTDSSSTNTLLRSIFGYTEYSLGCYSGAVVIVEPTVLSLQLSESGADDCSIPTVEQAAIWQGADLTNTTSTQLSEIGTLVYTIAAEIYTNSSMLLLMGRLVKQASFSRGTETLSFSCATDWRPSSDAEYSGKSCQDVLAELWKRKETALVGLTIDGVTNTSIHSGFVPSTTIQSKDYSTTYIITFSFTAAFAVALNTIAIILWARLRKDVKALNLMMRAQRRKKNQSNREIKSAILGSD
ncbi:Hypothetical protein GSB_153806, partial [Giardia duodenalis]